MSLDKDLQHLGPMESRALIGKKGAASKHSSKGIKKSQCVNKAGRGATTTDTREE